MAAGTSHDCQLPAMFGLACVPDGDVGMASHHLTAARTFIMATSEESVGTLWSVLLATAITIVVSFILTHFTHPAALTQRWFARVHERVIRKWRHWFAVSQRSIFDAFVAFAHAPHAR